MLKFLKIWLSLALHKASVIQNCNPFTPRTYWIVFRWHWQDWQGQFRTKQSLGQHQSVGHSWHIWNGNASRLPVHWSECNQLVNLLEHRPATNDYAEAVLVTRFVADSAQPTGPTQPWIQCQSSGTVPPLLQNLRRCSSYPRPCGQMWPGLRACLHKSSCDQGTTDAPASAQVERSLCNFGSCCSMVWGKRTWVENLTFIESILPSGAQPFQTNLTESVKNVEQRRPDPYRAPSRSELLRLPLLQNPLDHGSIGIHRGQGVDMISVECSGSAEHLNP